MPNDIIAQVMTSLRKWSIGVGFCVNNVCSCAWSVLKQLVFVPSVCPISPVNAFREFDRCLLFEELNRIYKGIRNF